MTNEGLHGSPGVSRSERKTADRFPGMGSRGCADRRGGMPAPAPHSLLPLCQQKGALSLQASSPSFLLKTPAFPPSQTRGTLPVDDGVLISPPGLPAVRCRCPLQLKTPWVPGGCQSGGAGLSAPDPDTPRGTGCPLSRLPSLARDSETLANFSELRFRNDVNMETWSFGKLSGVYFRNCFFQGIRLQGHFLQELRFNGNHNISLCASCNIKNKKKNLFFFPLEF